MGVFPPTGSEKGRGIGSKEGGAARMLWDLDVRARRVSAVGSGTKDITDVPRGGPRHRDIAWSAQVQVNTIKGASFRYTMLTIVSLRCIMLTIASLRYIMLTIGSLRCTNAHYSLIKVYHAHYSLIKVYHAHYRLYISS